MAKLRDLVNVEANVDYIKIQDAEIPIMFSMSTFDFIREAYGKPYAIFEKELNQMLKQKRIVMNPKEVKLVRALVYGMVRAGGTECTMYELEGSMSISDLHNVYSTVMNVFVNQNFQQNDLETLKKQPKNQKKKQPQNRKNPKKR